MSRASSMPTKRKRQTLHARQVSKRVKTGLSGGVKTRTRNPSWDATLPHDNQQLSFRRDSSPLASDWHDNEASMHVAVNKRNTARWFFANLPSLGGGGKFDDEEPTAKRPKAAHVRDIYAIPALLGVNEKHGVEEVLALFRPIPQHEVGTIVDLARRLRHTDFQVSDTLQLVTALIKLPDNRRRDFVLVVAPLLDGRNFHGNIIAKLFTMLQNMPLDEVKTIVDLAQVLCPPTYTANAITRIVQELILVDQAYRPEFVAIVQPLLLMQTSGFEAADIMKKLVVIPKSYLTDMVPRVITRMQNRTQLSLSQKTRIIENEMLGSTEAAATLASDAHSSDRDKRTRDAVVLLSSAVTLTKADVDEDVRACTDFVRLKLGNTSVLDGLIKHTFDFEGITINGSDFVARLWHFASSATDHTEAKLGIVSALVDAAHSCNNGKVQRLAIAVLQGRLDGVEIDKLEHVVKWSDYIQAFNFKHADLMKTFLTLESGTTEEAACLKAICVAADMFCIDESIWFKPFWDMLVGVLGGDDDS